MKTLHRTLPLVWGALLSSACADDVTATSETEGDTEDGSSSSASTTLAMTTTNETSSSASATMTADTSGSGESSSDGSDGGSSSEGGSSSDGDSSSDGGSSESTGGGVMCGDGLVEGDELCDGADLGGQTCADEGLEAGLLGCAADCTGYDTSLCIAIPACVEEDLGSAVGPALALGDTMGEDEEFAIECAGAMNAAPDHTMLWVAPSAGVWRFSTEGSGYDTALAAYAGCDADSALACDDDGGDLPPTSSVLTLDLAAGDPVVVVVSGFSGSVGQWTLAIEAVELGGPCCAPHDGPGCDDLDCADSVCAADETCCQGDWSDNCANIAVAFCEICNTPDICGNGILDGMGEVCDGVDFGDETCVSQGYDGGDLECADDCSTLDVSGCQEFGGPCCSADLTPGCDDAQCTADVCAAQPFCCEVAWDAGCVMAADALCAAVCNAPGTCGNGLVDAVDEECDELALDGASCQDFGFDGGTLGCNGDCTLNPSGCADFSGDCCAPDMTPGCDDAACTALICGADPFCCNTAWDPMCVNAATNNCEACGGTPPVCGNDTVELGEVCDGAPPVGLDCTDQGFIGGDLACAVDCSGVDSDGCVANGGGDCCSPDATPGCDDLGCTSAVCVTNPACCENGWDAQCVAAAELVCVACGGVPGCLEEDLGSDLGNAVAAGTTVGEDEDFALSCIMGGGAVDHVLSWVAPAAGTYDITTIGSAYDTALGVFASCDVGSELACNDDGGGMLTSAVQIDLAANQSILIVVSGYNVATGNWALNITQQ